jgi:hypothetical protein
VYKGKGTPNRPEGPEGSRGIMCEKWYVLYVLVDC